MESAKQQVAKVLEQLPDDCSFEDIQYRLYVVETIRRRLELAERDDLIPHAQAEQRLEKRLPK